MLTIFLFANVHELKLPGLSGKFTLDCYSLHCSSGDFRGKTCRPDCPDDSSAARTEYCKAGCSEGGRRTEEEATGNGKMRLLSMTRAF